MTIDEFLNMVDDKAPPAPGNELAKLEGMLGGPLPDDYRQFLLRCNGGYVGGALWYKGPTPAGESADTGVQHIGGFREESYFSLKWAIGCYDSRIPKELMWIMDDPFGNAICLGVRGTHRGRVYFWDHEREPDPNRWDRQVETAKNVRLLANSFSEFVTGLKPTEIE